MVNPFEKMCKLLTSSLFFIVLLISFVILLLYHRVEDSDDMDRWKKISRFLSSVLFYSLIVILVIVGLMVGATAVDKFMGKKNNEIRNPLFGAYIIISPSMVPNINVYDAVITMRVSEKYIELYDIITFLSKEIETNGTPITHRVVGIVETEDGEKAYRTKGDANASEDRALIRQREVLGKVLLRIPMIGHVKTFLSSKFGWILMVVVPCLGIVGYDILKLTGLIKAKKETENEEEVNKKKKKDELPGKEIIDLNTVDEDTGKEKETKKK